MAHTGHSHLRLHIHELRFVSTIICSLKVPLRITVHLILLLYFFYDCVKICEVLYVILQFLRFFNVQRSVSFGLINGFRLALNLFVECD